MDLRNVTYVLINFLLFYVDDICNDQMINSSDQFLFSLSHTDVATSRSSCTSTCWVIRHTLASWSASSWSPVPGLRTKGSATSAPCCYLTNGKTCICWSPTVWKSKYTFLSLCTELATLVLVTWSVPRSTNGMNVLPSLILFTMTLRSSSVSNHKLVNRT